MRMLAAAAVTSTFLFASVSAFAGSDDMGSCALSSSGQNQTATVQPNVSQQPSLPPLKTAHVDQYGFHFTKDGMLIDDRGNPIIINDDGSMTTMPTSEH